MTADLKTQLRDYLEEIVPEVTIDEVLEQRLDGETIRPLQPRPVLRRRPRWALGIATAAAIGRIAVPFVFINGIPSRSKVFLASRIVELVYLNRTHEHVHCDADSYKVSLCILVSLRLLGRQPVIEGLEELLTTVLNVLIEFQGVMRRDAVWCPNSSFKELVVFIWPKVLI